MSTIQLLLIVSALFPSIHAVHWTKSPWGPTDEIGAANHITPASVLAASSLIRTGKTYALGMRIDSNTPAFNHRTFSLTVIQNEFGRAGITGLGDNGITGHDDLMLAWIGTGTQIDGLGHVGIRGTYYNGLNSSQFVRVTGLVKLGLEKVPPIVTRAVLLDMTTYYGKDIVDPGTAFTRAVIKDAEKKQGVKIKKGDVVLFHTGWQAVADDPSRFLGSAPGLGISGAWYLAKIGVVAIGTDTPAMEVIPGEREGEFAKVHTILIPKNGIYILENVYTNELAKDKVKEFMFVLGHALVRGAVQMIINPVGIV